MRLNKVQWYNLMVQRSDDNGSTWVNWCGPCTKDTADYYLSTVVNLLDNARFRVIPFNKG